MSLIVELDNSPTTRQDLATHALQLVLLASEPPLPHALHAQQVNSSTRTNVLVHAQAILITTRMETALLAHQFVVNAALPTFV